MERDGRAHSVLVSGSLDARVRWLEFPHIPSVSLKKRARGGEIWGGIPRWGKLKGIVREFEISVGHTAVASITLSFSFQTRFPARLSNVDSGE